MSGKSKQQSSYSHDELYELLTGLLQAINTMPNTVTEYLQSIYKKPIPPNLKQGITAKIHARYNEWAKSGGFNAQIFAECVIYTLTEGDFIQRAFKLKSEDAVQRFSNDDVALQTGAFTDEQALLKQLAYYKRKNATIKHNNKRKLDKMKAKGVNVDAVEAVFTELLGSKSGDLILDNVKKTLKLHKNEHLEYEVLKALSKLSGDTMNSHAIRYVLTPELKDELKVIKGFQINYLPLIKNFIRTTQKLSEAETQAQITLEDLTLSPLYKLTEANNEPDIRIDINQMVEALSAYLKRSYTKVLVQLVKSNIKDLMQKAIRDSNGYVSCFFFEV